MPAELGEHLRYDGKPLWQVDVSACQPLIASVLVRDPNWLHADEEYSCYEEGIKTLEGDGERGRGGRPIYVMTPLLSSSPEYTSVSELVKMCSDGRVYEHFVHKLGFPLDHANRNWVKKQLIQVLCGQDYLVDETAVGRALKREFPAFCEGLRRMKVGDHSRASHLLQRAESYAVIVKACGRMMRERPRVPLWSIHDSLCTTQENVAGLKRLLEEEFEAVFGVRPTVKAESFKARADKARLRRPQS